MPIRLFAPRYWPTWLGLGLMRLLAFLPYGWQVRLGKGLGTVLLHLPTSINRTARRNMELCMPAQSPEERRKLLAAHFQSLGISLFEIAFTWWASPRRVRKLIRIEGAENLHAALARGRGVILLSAHFTTLEMGGRMLASVHPTSFLYKPTKNAVARVVPGSLPLPVRRQCDSARRHPGADRRTQTQRVCLVCTRSELPQERRADGGVVWHPGGYQHIYVAAGAHDRRGCTALLLSSDCRMHRATARSFIPHSTTFRASARSPIPGDSIT